MLLVGRHKRTLDDKWRLPIPAELFIPAAAEGGETLYFAPNGSRLIFFTEKQFQQLAEQLFKENLVANEDLRRKFFGNTYPKVRDKNGRVQIPEPLRGRSGLTAREEVVIVGTGSYAEILPASADREESDEELKQAFQMLGARR